VRAPPLRLAAQRPRSIVADPGTSRQPFTTDACDVAAAAGSLG
jgi:hypothetical protein